MQTQPQSSVRRRNDSRSCVVQNCQRPIAPRHSKYCEAHSRLASVLWNRERRRLNSAKYPLRPDEVRVRPLWLDVWWEKKALEGQTALDAYNAYMRGYMRRWRTNRRRSAPGVGSHAAGHTIALAVAVLIAVLWPLNALAAVLAFCLDVSGSMNVGGKINAARAALVEQVEQAQPGDVVYVLTFAIGNHLIGRLEVGEDRSTAEKQALIANIKRLRAGGPAGAHTNLDEALQGAKSALLLEPAPGTRKIIVVSDGISDPSIDHEKLDLAAIANMLPQGSGWALYIVGLPADIAGIFQTPPQRSGVVVAPEYPNVRGIAIAQFSRDKIDAAVAAAKDEPVIVATATPIRTQEPTPGSPSTPIPTTTPSMSSPERRSSALVPWMAASLAVIALPLSLMWFRKGAAEDLLRVVLEMDEGTGDDPRRYPLTFAERTTKTIGPRGDIALSDPELPPIVCTLERRTGQLWLAPHDAVTINGEPIANKTAVGIGDLIAIRQRVTLRIDDPQEEQS